MHPILLGQVQPILLFPLSVLHTRLPTRRWKTNKLLFTCLCYTSFDWKINFVMNLRRRQIAHNTFDPEFQIQQARTQAIQLWLSSEDENYRPGFCACFQHRGLLWCQTGDRGLPRNLTVPILTAHHPISLACFPVLEIVVILLIFWKFSFNTYPLLTFNLKIIRCIKRSVKHYFLSSN